MGLILVCSVLLIQNINFQNVTYIKGCSINTINFMVLGLSDVFICSVFFLYKKLYRFTFVVFRRVGKNYRMYNCQWIPYYSPPYNKHKCNKSKFLRFKFTFMSNNLFTCSPFKVILWQSYITPKKKNVHNEQL